MSLKTQNVSDRAPNGGHAVSICRGPPKKNSDFYLNIWPEAQHICVLGRLAGKTRKNGRKYAIFKNWIDTRLKMETHEPKTSRNTPQNGGVDVWVMRFHFWVSISPIFKNRVFSTVLTRFPC